MESENTKDPYRGVLGLDQLPKEIKALNWTICLAVATGMAISGYIRVSSALPTSPFRNALLWLAVVSPICLAVAWLRLTGVRWRYALILFIVIPTMLICAGRLFAWLGAIFYAS